MNIDNIILPLNSIKPEFIKTGHSDKFEDGLKHIRTTPFTTLVQVINGAYEITVDNKTEIIPSGESFLVGANQKTIITHNCNNKNGRFYMESHWIHFHFSLHDSIDLTSLFEMPLKITSEYKNEVNNLILTTNKILNETSTNIFQQNSKLHEIFFKLLTFICQISPLKSNALENLKTTDRLRPVFDYIQHNFTTSITPEQLAKIANLSLSRFHHLFKDVMKCSPLNFVKKIRIKKAQFLLLNSDMQLAEIAEEIGFLNQFHFSREFKTATGMAPSKFRVKCKEWS